MAQCEVCGNSYGTSFEVIHHNARHVFDTFQCAITALAPQCVHCGCRIIGQGVQRGSQMYCCAHCAKVAVPENA